MALPKNSVRDDNIDKIITWRTFWARDFVTYATQSAGSGGIGLSTLTSGFNPAAQVHLSQIGTTHHVGMRFSSVTTVAPASAPSIDFNVPLDDVDNNWPMYFRCEWTSSLAAAASTRPFFFYSTLTDGVAPSRPVTAMSIDAATSTKATPAHALTMTRASILGKLGTGAFAYETFDPRANGLSVKLLFATLSEASSTGVATDFLWVTRVQVGYTSKETFGTGSSREARFMSLPLLDVATQSI